MTDITNLRAEFLIKYKPETKDYPYEGYVLGKQEVFKELEKHFDVNHLCGCEKWCTCYKEFKEKTLK